MLFGSIEKFFTADGTSGGVVTVNDTSLFYINAVVFLVSNTQDRMDLMVTDIISGTQFRVRQFYPVNFTTYQDVSAYLVADGARVVRPNAELADPGSSGGGGSPTGPAGGDLGATYPNPTVTAIHETSGPTGLVIGTITDGEFLKRVGSTLVSGVPSTGISALTGDVTASGSGSVLATVAFVDGSSATNVHLAELLANAATSANTASTIVKRDSSGNFTAGTITAALTGTASGNAPAALTSAHLFVGNASNIATDTALSGDGTINNTGLLTVTQTSGVSFAASATTDTTNASNISSGTLNNLRLSAIPNSALATMPGHTYKGNNTASVAAVIDVTTTQLTADLNVFTSSLQGLVPSSGGGTSNFLRADGTFAVPGGTGITALTGDVTASGSGSVSATVTHINGTLLGSTTATNANLLIADGTQWNTEPLSGDATITNAGVITVTKTNNVAFTSSATTSNTSANTASTLVLRDSNSNFLLNEAIFAVTSIVTAGTTTTLTVSSAPIQKFTGSSTQTVVLPDATTLSAGQWFCVKNRSTGLVTVNKNGGSLLQTVAAGTDAYLYVTDISTSTGVWDITAAQTSSNINSSLVFRDPSGNFSATTITAALTGTASGNLTYTANNHGVLLSGSANTVTVLAPDSSTAKVLTSGGSSADPTWSNTPTLTGTNFTGIPTAAVTGLSGTNSGDITLAAVGSSPNANAASLSGQALNLQPFDGTNPGVVAASGGGTANFLRADGTWQAPSGTAGITALTGDVTAAGPGSVAATVARINGVALGSTTATSGNILIGSGSQWVTNTVGGDGTLSSAGNLIITETNGVAFTSSATTTNASTATASTLSLRDSNANQFANNFVANWTTHASGGGLTLNLFVNTSQYHFFTGSGATQVNLPDETTLPQAGFFYVLENNETISLTVKDNGGSTILLMPTLTRAIFTATSIASASAGWDVAWVYTASATANTANTNVARDGSGNFSAGTITAALTGTASGNTTYSANNHGVVLSSGTNAMTVIAPDASTAKVLTSGGSSADPTWSNTPALSGANFASATIPDSALANGAVANLSGTNSGDVTLAAVGSSPSANGASLSGQALTLQPADATHPGVVALASTTNTASAAVLRDSSGNFAAGTITAALTGTASGNATLTPNNHGAVVSGSANALTVVAPDASLAKVLTSGGASADPTWALSQSGSFNTISSTLNVDSTVNILIKDHLQVSAHVDLGGRLIDDGQVQYITNWVSYTPTGSWTTNTTYTGMWRRVGDTLEAKVHIALAGAPNSATTLSSISLPSGLAIDTAKLLTATANEQVLGVGHMECAGDAFYLISCVYATPTTIRPVGYTITGNTYNSTANSGVGDATIHTIIPATFATGDLLDMTFAVPIAGWNI